MGGKLRGRDVIPYIPAQLVGATVAGVLLRAAAPSSIGTAAHRGAPMLFGTISVARGIFFELLMTFLLVLAVYGTIVDKHAPKIGGLEVGLIVLTDVLAGVPSRVPP